MSPARGPRLEDSENDAFARGRLLSRTHSAPTHHKEENTPLTRAQSSEKSEMGWGENIKGKEKEDEATAPT